MFELFLLLSDLGSRLGADERTEHLKRQGEITYGHYSRNLPFKHKKAAAEKVTFGKKLDNLVTKKIAG